jgi:hypothetical protein
MRVAHRLSRDDSRIDDELENIVNKCSVVGAQWPTHQIVGVPDLRVGIDDAVGRTGTNFG